MDIATLRADLTRDEGLRLKPYPDTVGKLTIGVGRNLDDVGISEDEAAILLTNDIANVMHHLDVALPWWQQMDPVRQRVLANLCFNLGISKLMEFKNTLILMESGRYEAAAEGLEQSRWHRQVGPRAQRLEFMMRTGKDPA